MYIQKLLTQLIKIMLVALVLVGCQSSPPAILTPAPSTVPPEREILATPLDYKAGTTRVSEADGMVMVFIPAGPFKMGSSDRDPEAEADEYPQHLVYLDAYWIDQTEVTNAMYKRCFEAGICTFPLVRQGKLEALSNLPVQGVDWTQAVAYCEWVGRRLPTEAEWEKAARGPDERLYPWGNTLSDPIPANFNFSTGGLTEVGSYPDGASPYGVLDMAGNIWEWVADWYDEAYYETSPYENPPGPTTGASLRVLRGGAWNTISRAVRVTNRFWAFPYRNDHDGFRCASDHEAKFTTEN